MYGMVWLYGMVLYGMVCSMVWYGRAWVFGFLLIEISSRKAVREVTSTFPGPLHTIKVLSKLD